MRSKISWKLFTKIQPSQIYYFSCTVIKMSNVQCCVSLSLPVSPLQALAPGGNFSCIWQTEPCMCADSHVTCCVVLHNSHVTFVLENVSDDSQLSCEYVTLCVVSCNSRLSVCGGGWKSYLCSSVQTSHCRPGICSIPLTFIRMLILQQSSLRKTKIIILIAGNVTCGPQLCIPCV